MEVEKIKKEVDAERKKEPRNNGKIADKLFDIGCKYQDLGKLDDAMRYFNECLEIRKQILGSNHIVIASTYFSIGRVFIDQMKFNDALYYLNLSLDIIKEILPENDPNISATRTGIALVYSYQGKFKEALNLYNQLLQIYAHNNTDNNQRIASTFHNIGLVYHDQGFYNEALEYYKKSLEKESIFSMPNPNKLNRIGKAYLSLKRYDEAWENINTAFKIRKEKLPSDHFLLGDTFNSIGEYYRVTGRFSESLKNYNEALTIYRKHSPIHPFAANTLYNMGLLYYEKRDFNESLNYFIESLNVRRITWPSTHPDFAKNTNFIGLSYKNLENYERALDYLNDETERKLCEKLLQEKRQKEQSKNDISNTLTRLSIQHNKESRSSESSSSSSRSKREEEDPLIGETFKSRYMTKNLLGKGSFGRVFLVYDEKDKTDKAMKMLEKFESNENESNDTLASAEPELSEIAQNELKLMKQISHENIVRYYDNFDEKCYKSEYLCIIFEYCKNRDLKIQIKQAKDSNTPFGEMKILKWTLEATNGLKCLHSNNIIHRDIKPENIFLDGNNVIKLGDLGIAKLLENTKAKTFAGTLLYMSPEQFRCLSEHEEYSAKTDIWSLGCVVFELLFLKIAFPRGQKGNPDVPDLGSTLFSKILKRMLDKDIAKRLNSTDLYNGLLKIKDFIDDE